MDGGVCDTSSNPWNVPSMPEYRLDIRRSRMSEHVRRMIRGLRKRDRRCGFKESFQLLAISPAEITPSFSMAVHNPLYHPADSSVERFESLLLLWQEQIGSRGMRDQTEGAKDIASWIHLFRKFQSHKQHDIAKGSFSFLFIERVCRHSLL